MDMTALSLVGLRLRHEFRRFSRRRGPLQAKILGILYPLWLVLFPVLCWDLATRLLPPASQRGTDPVALFWAVTFTTALVHGITATAETLRFLAHDRQSEMLALSSLPASTIAGYQIATILLANAPYLLGIITLPSYFAVLLGAGKLSRLLFVLSLLFWVTGLALWASVLLLAAAGHRCWPKKSVASIAFAACITSLVAGLSLWLHGGDARILAKLPSTLPQPAALAAFSLLLAGAGWLHLRQAVLRWAAAVSAADFAPWRRPAVGASGIPFSSVPAWSLLQKDLRDLWRNPAYRVALLGAVFLLALAVYGQARGTRGPEAATTRRLMFQLSLLQLAPGFLISGRTMALEEGLLDLYRAVWPDPGRLLRLKIAAQSVLNVFLVIAGAAPFYFFLRPGPGWWEVGYFVGSTLAFVPVLTVLAVSLGTIFPNARDSPSAFGMRMSGLLVYLAATVPLYSFLLNRMAAGAATYGALLAATVAVLFVFARRTLSRGD